MVSKSKSSPSVALCLLATVAAAPIAQAQPSSVPKRYRSESNHHVQQQFGRRQRRQRSRGGGIARRMEDASSMPLVRNLEDASSMPLVRNLQGSSSMPLVRSLEDASSMPLEYAGFDHASSMPLEYAAFDHASSMPLEYAAFDMSLSMPVEAPPAQTESDGQLKSADVGGGGAVLGSFLAGLSVLAVGGAAFLAKARRARRRRADGEEARDELGGQEVSLA